MIRALGLTFLLALPALAAGAETASIRSGEHATHSRLVIEPEEPAGWSLGRTDTGYELRFDRAGIEFDTGGIFRLIPRTRLADVQQAADSALALTVAPGHHLRAFETARGVALDVYAGPAPASSPYEAALPPRAPAAAVSEQAAAVEPAPQPAEVIARPEPAANRADLPVLARRSPPERPPVIAAIAGAVAAMRSGTVLPPEPAEPAPASAEPPATVAAAPAEPVLQATPAPQAARTEMAPLTLARPFRAPATPETQLELLWRGTLDPAARAEAEAETPAPPTAEAAPIQTARAETARDETEATATLPLPLFAQQGETGMVNTRVAEAEAELLHQLSRAAAQGLVRAEVPELRPAPAADTPGTDAPEPAPEPVPETMAEAEAGDETGLAAHFNIRSKTSIDRELSKVVARLPVTAEGKECLADSVFDLPGWGDERPMLIQLGEARGGLVGEFDRPTPGSVERLVHLYLYYGFGAEAQATMQSFPGEVENADVLKDVAMIFDLGRADPAGRVAGMVDCDTAAALWGLLARADIGPGDTVNSDAALRAFSALPLHLRRMLGELLAQRFLQMQEPESARAVRDSILRAPGEHGISISMINARLELARGNRRAAEPLLEEVVRANGPDSVEAMILYVEARLQDGLPVDPGMVANAAALAFEFKGSAPAAALERAQVLGHASNGEFAEAFAALARWRRGGIDALQAQVKDELFAMLAAPEASQLFLTHYFANRDLVRPDEASAELRLALSERLLSFGFTDEARRMRGADAAGTETGRLFLARAALADFDGAEALRQLDGFDGTEARRLRADALRMLGRHDEATAAYLAADAPQEAGAEAWRAGQWESVAELDEGLRRQAVAAFGLVPGATPEPLATPPAPGPDGEEPGPLARNRALLDESRAARDLIDALLADAGTVTEGG